MIRAYPSMYTMSVSTRQVLCSHPKSLHFLFPSSLVTMDVESGIEKEGTKGNSRHEGDRSTNGMESLPPEITLDILSRLPITSLVHSKSVCRPWFRLAHDRRLVDIHLSRAAQSNPSLIFHSDYPIQNQLCFVDIDSQTSYQDTVKRLNLPFGSVMPEFEVVGSCNGFLCLSHSLFGNPQYIYNPITREYRELPQASDSPDQLVVYGFGFHQMTRAYKVVRLVHQRNEDYVFGRGRRVGYEPLGVGVFTLGNHSWRDIGRAPYSLDSWASKAALVNGCLHWLTQPRRNQGAHNSYRSIVSFDLAGEQFDEVPRPQCGGLDRCNYYLVVFEGDLSAVVYGENCDLEIWVMKDYAVSESWMKEFTIRGYVPVGLEQQVGPPICPGIDRISKINVRVVCVLKNGDILLEFKGRALVSYNPDREEFKELKFHGLPRRFQTVLHVGTFISIDGADAIER